MKPLLNRPQSPQRLAHEHNARCQPDSTATDEQAAWDAMEAEIWDRHAERCEADVVPFSNQYLEY